MRARSAVIARVVASSLVALGCGPKASDGPPVGISTSATPLPSATSDKVVAYAFDSLDERPVSSEAMHGKPTVIAFVTTGDIVGQAQVSYLVHMAKNDGERVNYAVVALHPRKEVVLVEAYRKTLGVEFPVALGEAANGTGPFGDIPVVPTVVILDRAGRLVWKRSGLVKNEELRAHIKAL